MSIEFGAGNPGPIYEWDLSLEYYPTTRIADGISKFAAWFRTRSAHYFIKDSVPSLPGYGVQKNACGCIQRELARFVDRHPAEFLGFLVEPHVLLPQGSAGVVQQ